MFILLIASVAEESSAALCGRQSLCQLFHRLTAMADGVLLLGTQLGKGLAEGLVVEIGIVAESPYAAGLVDDETICAFAREFGGVEHRIELVRERHGVRWYNDSIASSPSRTIAGLNSFAQRVILIAGGKDKGISYTEIGPVINEHVKLLILCGATAGVIREATLSADNYDGLEIIEVDDYQTAVALADERTQDGDIVILSPASTSFDRFKNFEERGRVFKDLVRQLPE